MMAPATKPSPKPTPVRGEGLRRVNAQVPGDEDPLTGSSDDFQNYQIRLDPPGPEVLFRLESEEQLQERIRQEFKQRNDPENTDFPEKPVLTKENWKGRTFPRQVCLAEPTYVMHRRLFFEEENAERFGWDLGVIQPLVSLGEFYKDVIFFPYHFGTNPHVRYDASPGKCLPGDPTPYLLYPPGFSITGGLNQAGTVIGLAGIFP